jgi:hypothetical protein
MRLSCPAARVQPEGEEVRLCAATEERLKTPEYATVRVVVVV